MQERTNIMIKTDVMETPADEGSDVVCVSVDGMNVCECVNQY